MSGGFHIYIYTLCLYILYIYIYGTQAVSGAQETLYKFSSYYYLPQEKVE